MDSAQRYWAFISYSHKDRGWANWLHRSIENYYLPRRLVGGDTPVGPIPRRIKPLFKDRDELAASRDLRSRVYSALDQSKSLIVICSPDAARSRWVKDELGWFQSRNSRSRVFAVIVAGTPNASDMPGCEGEECFPAELRHSAHPAGQLGLEKLDIVAADLRANGDGRRLAKLKLVAGILGVDLDELVQRDTARRTQQLIAVSAASLVGAASMGALAVAAISSREQAREALVEAQAQRGKAESLVEFMLGDLSQKLRPSGQLEILDAVGSRAMSYYRSQAASTLAPGELGQRARVLHLLGDIADERGDLAGAFRDFQQAAQTTSELLQRQPDDPQRIFEHAQSVFWVGYVAEQRGDQLGAEGYFRRYVSLAERLVSIDPHNDNWSMEVEEANVDLGTILLGKGQSDAALATFSKALIMGKHLVAKSPHDRARRVNVAQSYAWLADSEAQKGRFEQARRDRLSERAICAALMKENANDNQINEEIVVNETAMADLLAANGALQDAVDQLKLALTRSHQLIAVEPSNAAYQAQAAVALLTLSQLKLKTNHVDDASAFLVSAKRIIDGLIQRDQTVVRWNGDLLGRARIAQIRIAATRAKNAHQLINALAPARGEARRLSDMVREPNANFSLVRVAAEAALLGGDYDVLTGRTTEANAAWAAAVGLLERSGALERANPSDRSYRVLNEARVRLKARPARPSSIEDSALQNRPQDANLNRTTYTW
jgi:tetratricopeptide (TPR) repeat protein